MKSGGNSIRSNPLPTNGSTMGNGRRALVSTSGYRVYRPPNPKVHRVGFGHCGLSAIKRGTYCFHGGRDKGGDAFSAPEFRSLPPSIRRVALRAMFTDIYRLFPGIKRIGFLFNLLPTDGRFWQGKSHHWLTFNLGFHYLLIFGLCWTRVRKRHLRAHSNLVNENEVIRRKIL